MAHQIRQVQWQSASQIVTAYQIGKGESVAAMKLLRTVPEPIVDCLHEAVKHHSLQVLQFFASNVCMSGFRTVGL